MIDPRPARCPRCYSLERHRLLWLYLRDATDFFSRPQRLLHVAPEYCFLRVWRHLPHLDYVTADLSSPWLNVRWTSRTSPWTTAHST
jgi:hypothetical protein